MQLLFLDGVRFPDTHGAYTRLVNICDKEGVIKSAHSLSFQMLSSLFGGSGAPHEGPDDYKETFSTDNRRYLFPDERPKSPQEVSDTVSSNLLLCGHRSVKKSVEYDLPECDAWLEISYISNVALIVKGENVPYEISHFLTELISDRN